MKLSFTDVCAVLEEKGWKRKKIKHLTRWYVKRVLFHDRDEKGRLRFDEQENAPRISLQERLRLQLRRQNCPWYMMEAVIKERLGG